MKQPASPSLSVSDLKPSLCRHGKGAGVHEISCKVVSLVIRIPQALPASNMHIQNNSWKREWCRSLGCCYVSMHIALLWTAACQVGCRGFCHFAAAVTTSPGGSWENRGWVWLVSFSLKIVHNSHPNQEKIHPLVHLCGLADQPRSALLPFCLQERTCHKKEPKSSITPT